MPDFSGPIQPLELARWLWLIPFFPLAGALIQATYCSGLLSGMARAFTEGKSVEPRFVAPQQTIYRVALGSIALSAATSLAYVGVLVQVPASERFLLQHLWQLVRVGSLDAGFALALDPLSAALVLVVSVLATLAAAFAATSDELECTWSFFASWGAFVFFVLVALLADNLLLLLFGWGGVGCTGYSLATPASIPDDGPSGVRTFLVQRAGDASIFLAIALLVWGLGGSWTREGVYQSDLEPRISAVSVTKADEPPALAQHDGTATQGKGFVTVTGLSGSLVYSDDSRTPILDGAGLPLRTPFRRHELAGGAHSFRVAPDDDFRIVEREKKVGFVTVGGVLANYTVGRQPLGDDREVALVVVGPTLTFRELRDELVLMDGKGAHPVRDGLATRTLSGGAHGGVHLVTVVCLLLLIGVVAKSGTPLLGAWLPVTSRGGTSVSALVHASGMALIGVYLIARLGFLFSLSHAASAVLVVVGAGAALYGALASAFQYDVKRLLAFSTMSQVGLAVVALGAGAYGAAVFQVATHAVVKTCLLLSFGAAFSALQNGGRDEALVQDLREMGGLATTMPRVASACRFGCLALTVVPIPLLSGFWPLSAILVQTFTATSVPYQLGQATYAVLVATMALTSFAVWRGYYLAFAGTPRAKGKKAASGAKPDDPAASVLGLLSVLAWLSALLGAVLGASAGDVGGEGESMFASWLAPVFATAPTPFSEVPAIGRFGLVAIGVALSYVGWFYARRRYGDGRASDWIVREESILGQRFGASVR